MNFLHKLLRRMLDWLERGGRSPQAATPDQIGENLRAAISADARAKAANVETYQARVEAMIADFFAKYGGRHVRPS